MATTMASVPTSPTLKRARDEQGEPSPPSPAPSSVLSSAPPSPLSPSPFSYHLLTPSSTDAAADGNTPVSSALTSPLKAAKSLETLTPAASSPAAATEGERPAKKTKVDGDKVSLKTAAQIEKEQKRLAKESERLRKEEEKAVKEAEKAAKEAEKAEKKKQKEAEKAAKEAERIAKQAEKEEEKRRKDEEKKKKDEEKQAEKDAKEEEKKKKERSQMRLNHFFKLPPVTKQPEQTDRAATPPIKSEADTMSASPSKTTISDYEKMFLPFCAGTNVTLAPFCRFSKDAAALEFSRSVIDQALNEEPLTKLPPFNPKDIFKLSRTPIPRGRKCISVQSIMEGLPNSFIKREPGDDKAEQLSKVQYKYLKFYEDVRPPYMGSYTKEPLSGVRKIARNPHLRDLPDKDYDYDSEPEWQEPEEGEDIGSDLEDEDEGMSETGDLDGFLDDADDQLTQMKRVTVQVDLQPESTGLCWEDPARHTNMVNADSYRMEILHENLDNSKPIDPFANHYWGTPASARAMDPPRAPLQSAKITSYTVNGGQTTLPSASTSKAATPGKKLIPAEDLPAFKEAINGSDLSKAGLIEVLYKKFPKHGKAAVKDTLEAVAKRVGSKQAEKRWVLNE